MGNIIVAIIIIALLAGAIYKLYLNKKNNVSCSACSSCPFSDKCHDIKVENKKSQLK